MGTRVKKNRRKRNKWFSGNMLIMDDIHFDEPRNEAHFKRMIDLYRTYYEANRSHAKVLDGGRFESLEEK